MIMVLCFQPRNTQSIVFLEQTLQIGSYSYPWFGPPSIVKSLNWMSKKHLKIIKFLLNISLLILEKKLEDLSRHVNNWLRTSRSSWSQAPTLLIPNPETHICLDPECIQVSCLALTRASEGCCKALGKVSSWETASHFRFHKCEAKTLGDGCSTMWKWGG